MEWLSQLNEISGDVEFFQPASPAVITSAECAVGSLPRELRDVLTQTNGLACRSFRLLSAFDRDQPKKTWESLERANDRETLRALGRTLLDRFLVFADIGNGVAAWDRRDGSIWFEEAGDDQLHQIDLTLREFIETMVQNAD